jgi:uncharacterized protein
LIVLGAVATYLLDVNVLIALVDPAHVQHELAHTWFARVGRKSFATCPVTEMGLLRIVGHPKYPNSPGPPGMVAQSLAAIRALPGHHFWPDTISLADATHADATRLASHNQVIDTYLLALAKAQGGRLASLDARLNTSAVAGGEKVLALL